MMKTKCKENQENQENPEEDVQPQPQQQQQQQSNNNKRKAMEEGLSPDRTRPRFGGGLTVASN